MSTTPELNRQFWGGYHQESSWAVGADYVPFEEALGLSGESAKTKVEVG